MRIKIKIEMLLLVTEFPLINRHYSAYTCSSPVYLLLIKAPSTLVLGTF